MLNIISASRAKETDGRLGNTTPLQGCTFGPVSEEIRCNGVHLARLEKHPFLVCFGHGMERFLPSPATCCIVFCYFRLFSYVVVVRTGVTGMCASL